MTKLPKRPFELVKINKSTMGAPKSTCSIVSIKKPQGNLTPSVSIAPVAKKPPPVVARPPSDTDSEAEDTVDHPEEKEIGTCNVKLIFYDFNLIGSISSFYAHFDLLKEEPINLILFSSFLSIYSEKRASTDNRHFFR